MPLSEQRARQHVAVIPEIVDVRAIRKSLGLTQMAFAATYGFNIHTLRQWEQRIREPESPTRAYLTVIQRIPLEIARVLAAT